MSPFDSYSSRWINERTNIYPPRMLSGGYFLSASSGVIHCLLFLILALLEWWSTRWYMEQCPAALLAVAKVEMPIGTKKRWCQKIHPTHRIRLQSLGCGEIYVNYLLNCSWNLLSLNILRTINAEVACKFVIIRFTFIIMILCFSCK